MDKIIRCILNSARKMAKKGELAMANAKKKTSNSRKVRLRFSAPQAQSVCVAGSFNQWNTNATPMKKNKFGFWEANLELIPGTYEYRFYVDGQWRDDTKAADLVANPFGSQNSVLIVK